MSERVATSVSTHIGNEKLRHGLLTQTLMLAASTAIGQLIVAAMFIWTARVAGPQEFGPVVAAIGVGSTVAGFLDFGSNSLWVRELATSRMSLNSLGERLASKIVFAAFATACWFVAFFILAPQTLLWVAAPIALSLVLSQSFVVPLRAAGRSDLVALSMLFDRIVASVVFVGLIVLKVEATLALWSAMATGPIAASALTRWTLSQSRKPSLRVVLGLNPWSGSGYYGMSAGAVSAQALDISIMNFVGGPAVAGLYGAVNRWTQPMSLLAGSFTTSAAPIVARSDSFAEAWPQVKRSAWLVLGAVLMCVTVSVLAEPLVQLLVGSEYQDSGTVLRVLALGTIGAVLNQPLASFLQALGRDRIVSAITTSGVAVQLMLVAGLTLQFGAVGASVSYCVLQLLILVLLLTTVLTSRRRRALPPGRHFR